MKLKTISVDALLTIHPDLVDQKSMWIGFIEKVIMADAIYPFAEYIIRRTDNIDFDKHCRVVLGSVLAGRIDHYLYFQHCRQNLIQGWPHWITHPDVKQLVEMNSITEATSLWCENDHYRVMVQQYVDVLGASILTDVNIGHLSITTTRPTDDEWDMYIAIAEVFIEQKRDETNRIDFSYDV